MTNKKTDGPTVTLEQIEKEITEHGDVITDLTAARDEILNRENRQRLADLFKQQEEAVKGKDGALTRREKARDAVTKAQAKLDAAKKREQQAIQELSMAELAVRQVKHEIDQAQRQLQG